MRLSDFYASEEINECERELLAFFLRTLRGDHASGNARRRVSYNEQLDVLRAWAFELEKRAARDIDPDLLRQSEALDVAANTILAVTINYTKIEPIFRGYGKQLNSARRNERWEPTQ